MEPDIDKILSHRIRHTELRPVAWNKRAVWRKVESETNPNRRSFIFYYAAAAMVSLLIYVAVEQIPNEKTPQVAVTESMPRQKARTSEGPVMPMHSQKKASAPVTAKRNFTRTAPKKKVPITGNSPASPQLKMPTADFAAQSVSPDIQLPEEIALALEQIEIPAQRIRPVVGIIGDSNSQNIADVKRKKRLRKLEPSPAVPWEDPGNALVFAVRK